MNDLYLTHIYERYKSLKESKKIIDNKDLSKIFEYYTCIKLTEKYNKQFYEYSDIEPDSGIDCCDLVDSIVQCKLIKNTLLWTECSIFV